MLETIISISSRENADLQAVSSKTGERLSNTRTVTMRDGVAIIPVIGVIFPRASLFTEISGGVSVQTLASDFQAALDNPAVKSIVLNIDSPGGEVTGVSEFANMIYAARSQKKITAYVMGWGASAAYWIASAAEKVVIDSTAEVGSIGVIAAYQDAREKDSKNGIKTHEIVSSVSPNKRPDPATAEGKSQIQAVVDDLGEIFVNTVARNRGVSADVVRSDFGKGGVFVGEKAVKQGLADSVGSLEQVINDTQSKNEKHSNRRLGMDLEKLKAEHPEVYKAAFEEGRVIGSKATVEQENQWIEIGAKAERERIASIEALPAEGCADVIAAAKLDPKATKESVSFLILEKQKQIKTAQVEAVRADAQGVGATAQTLGAGSAGSSDSTEAAEREANAKKISEGIAASRK
jgi:signal peptide peptidase SppA